MTNAKSNYAAQLLNDIFAKRQWHRHGKIHVYPTENEHTVHIQWSCQGAAEIVEAAPLALLRWLEKAPRRWADLADILTRKLQAGQVPAHTPHQQILL